MVAYSFKKRFVPSILTGVKDQTIRAERVGPIGHAQPGKPLQLYTGMRTRQCELILRTVCLDLRYVRLRFRPSIMFDVGLKRLSTREMKAFARRDGFADLDDMAAFWAETKGAPDVFVGKLIRWKAPEGPVELGATVAELLRA